MSLVGEPLVGHGSLVAEVDAGARLAVVRGANAGPAGTAGLQLGDDLELDIDVAAPSTFVAASLHLPSDGAPGTVRADARQRLESLLGVARVEALVALVRAARDNGTRYRRGRLNDERGQSRGGDSRGGRQTGDAVHGDARVAAALNRAALAYMAAGEVGAPLLVRASGLLEAAVELARLTVPGLASIVRHDARRGADLLLGLAESAPLAVPSAAASAMAALLRTAKRADGRGTRSVALAALADAIARGEHTGSYRGRPTSQPHAAHGDAIFDITPTRPGVTVDMRALPGALAATRLLAQRTGTAEIQVRIPGWANRRDGLWARAFRAHDDVLIALAPLRRDDRDAVGRLLVPTEATEHVEVDVTDRPELPRPSATLSAAQRAIYRGSLAARAERLGSPTHAADHWRQCAHGWLTGGDRSRAEQAYVWARELHRDARPPDRVIAPLVSDLLQGVTRL